MDDQSKMQRGEQPRDQPEEAVRMPFVNGFRSGLRMRWLRAALLIAGLSSLVFGAMVVRLYHAVSHQVVIHYTTLFGIDSLGPWWWLVVIAGVPLAIAWLNLCLAVFLRQDQRFTITLTSVVSLFLTGLVNFGLVLILQANRTLLL